MMDKQLPDDRDHDLWREAMFRLLECPPPVPLSLQEAKRLVAELGHANEPLSERIRRAMRPVVSVSPRAPLAVFKLDSDGAGTELIEDCDDARKSLLHFLIGFVDDMIAPAFTPFTEVIRMGTTSYGAEAELPDPGRPLTSEDGRFRIWAEEEEGHIRISIEAIGIASEEFANKQIGICVQSSEDAQGSDS